MLKSFPAELSLAALICVLGLLEAAVLALVVESRSNSVWSIHFDANFLAAIYGVRFVFTFYLLGKIVLS